MSNAETAPIQVRDIFTSAALHIFGREGYDALARRNWRLTILLGVPLGWLANILQVFGPALENAQKSHVNFALYAAILSASLFGLLLIPIILRSSFCRKCAFPCVLSLILAGMFTLLFGLQLLTGQKESGIPLEPAAWRETFEEWGKKQFPALLKPLDEKLTKTLEVVKDVQVTVEATKKDTTALLTQQKVDSETNAETNAILKEVLKNQNKTQGVPENVIIELARRIVPQVADKDQALRTLESAVNTAAEIIKTGAGAATLDAFVNEVFSHLAELTKAGKFEEASQEADKAIAAWERDEKARLEAVKTRGIALLQAGMRQDLLRPDAKSAASKILRIVELTTPDATQLFNALRDTQRDWAEHGRDKGDNLALLVAIELGEHLVSRATNADERGYAFNALGIALGMLGERESDTTKLEAAVIAYKNALQERKRELTPLDWATVRNNLGLTLFRLGEREDDTVKLEEAARAFNEALQERTRERVPLDWATTKNNLGLALFRLGERENDTTKLKAAVNAFNEALQERTRERVPLGWATTQNNLGLALFRLGERENDTTKLEAAVTAFNEALQEWTRERVPLDWAQSFSNRATSWIVIAEQKGNIALAKQALADLDEALLVARTGNHAPLTVQIENNMQKAHNLIATLEGR